MGTMSSDNDEKHTPPETPHGFSEVIDLLEKSLPNCYSGLGLFVTDCNNKPRVFANPPEPRKQLAKGLHAFWIVECRRRWKSGFVIVDGSVVWKVLEE